MASAQEQGRVIARRAVDGDGTDALRRIIADARQRNVTAQELVLASLRDAILTGVLPPGARLRQEELAELFNTSRIPVRESLRALEYEGLVHSEPHRGFTVTPVDADDVEEVYDLRFLLESHAVRLAIPLLTDDDLEQLERLFEKVRNAKSPDEGLAAREAFYISLYSVTGRPRLVGLIVRLRQEVARALRWPTIQHAPAVHEQFFDAVKTGDAERAVAQLSAHYHRVAMLIRRYLREADAQERGNGLADRRSLR
ncbi:MAG TPA: GntR family transcriptional regulator [Candidatus Limnocylindrales bacterium]|nr:GntR family transcriptional regulator [Candidatus Limnocylindrales bacterium]